MEPLLHHTGSLVPVSPRRKHGGLSQARKIKPCTRAGGGTGGCCCCFSGWGAGDGPFVSRSPTVFSKNKPERLLIKGQASVCV